MSLAPSLFASPALGTRERSGSNPPDSRQSPFGAYASPPPSSFGQQGFGEPRRRRAAETTPLGNGHASPRHVPRAPRSPGPPTASLLDEQMPRQPPDLFSPPRPQHASPMACEPDDAPLFSRAEPAGTGVFFISGRRKCFFYNRL